MAGGHEGHGGVSGGASAPVGLSGYASLLKQKNNPYERRMQTTAGVMNSMPRDGGVTGLEGLGRLPLMYALGRDQAAAEEFDRAEATKGDSYLKEMQTAQTAKEARETAFRERELGLKEKEGAALIDYRKAQKTKEVISAAKDLAEAGNEGEAVKLLNQGGIPATAFKVTPAGVQAQLKNGNWWMLSYQGGSKIFDPNWKQDNGWRTPTAEEMATLKDAPKRDTIQRGSQEVTQEWDPEQGKYVDVASGPKWDPNKGGGKEGAAEGRDFRAWVGQLDGLYKSRASIEKGFDPVTGQVIPQTQIETAKRTVQAQIADKENYISSAFPDQWKQYKASAPAPGTGGKPLDETTARFILNNAGGDKELARKMARDQGYMVQ